MRLQKPQSNSGSNPSTPAPNLTSTSVPRLARKPLLMPSESSSLTTPNQSLHVPRPSVHKVLDFDIETRLIGFYQAGKFKPQGCEPIAIAASWVGSDEVQVKLQPDHSVPELLEFFVSLYDQARVVTGHYITKFDLPIINGSLLEHGLPLLGPKLVSDTKCDLVRREGFSASQENLSEMLDVVESKYHMNDPRWRQATRLTPEGIKLTRSRVVGDVLQHKQLRHALIQAGALRPARMWKP